MGSIASVFKPDEWVLLEEGTSKINSEDTIYKMKIGYYQDPLTKGDLWEYISKDNYEKIITGEYSCKIFRHSVQKIIIFDKDGNVVTLVKGKQDEEYSPKQEEYIRELKMR